MPAFDAWVATRPRKNPDAPLSPFAMPEYVLAATTMADQLEAKAAAASVKAGADIQRADNYSLAVVLFAAALFFAGVSTRLHDRTTAEHRARPRLHHVPRERDLDRDVPGEPLRLSGFRGS